MRTMVGWWMLALALGGTTAAVAQNQAPVCDAATASPAALWPPNHKFVPIAVTGVTDPDGDPVAITVTAVAQDEPLADGGDGNTCPDAVGVGTATASVRAERSGRGDGRVYHIAFDALDGQGGSCAGAIVVCVRHDNGRGDTCGDQGPAVDATGATPADACSSACRPEACAPGDDDLAPAACEAGALPARAARRVSRARDLLARSATVSGTHRARRLGKRAARHLHAAAGVVIRAADRGALGSECAAALAHALDDARDCAACDDD